MIQACCHARRGEAVRDHATLNGIEFLEVLDDDAPSGSPRQRTLLVRTCKPMAGLEAENVRIEGGTRIREVRVEWAFVADVIAGEGVLSAAEAAFVAALADPSHLLVVRTDVAGDFSTYTLRLVAGTGLSDPPASFDPVLAAVEFSFKAECPTSFDCLDVPACPPEALAAPLLDYLAKDYAGFRRLMLDRLALLVPGWTERNPADVGVALVELLAYAGDSLSYQQDAVATEAYLDTARRRTSVRRHARLVDYFMHDGRNARAFVQVQPAVDALAVPAGTQLLSRASVLLGPVVVKGSPEHRRALGDDVAVFETMHRAVLYPAHDTMPFYSWGDEVCVLCPGATTATLRDGATAATRLRLRAGDVLVLEERIGPRTGRPEDADPALRHAVRLTRVEPEAGLVLTNGVETDRAPAAPIADPLTGQRIVKVEWHREDALPFALCLSSPGPGTVLADVSVARGNVVLADHGLTLEDPDDLGVVPAPGRERVSETDPPLCAPAERDRVPARFRPRLSEGPVSQIGHVVRRAAGGVAHRLPFDPEGSARSVFDSDLRRALPAVRLTSDGSDAWTPERELLDSRPADRHFVVETEADGVARLRFGDGAHGARPAAGSVFAARYRVGNGPAGNVGAEALAHVVDDGGSAVSALTVRSVRNPLAGRGGVGPETSAEVRQKAPYAFRTQERAVTLDDYARAAERHPGLQQAAARFRWTGSWRTVFVTLDPEGGDCADRDGTLAGSVRSHLEKFRLAGYDLEVDEPRYVSLAIELVACVKAGYFGPDVERALVEVFSRGRRRDGRPGLFHPDRFTFGQPVYLSPLMEEALAVDGVASVRFVTFERQARPDQGAALREGVLRLDRLEIARLDNDPSFPERGTFRAAAVAAS